MRSLERRGQSSAEYAILIGVVITAIVGMQVYLKRSVQSKVKGVVDGMNFGSGCVVDPITKVVDCSKVVLQYEPYYTPAGAYNTKTTNTHAEEMKAGALVEKTAISESVERSGSATQSADLSTDDGWVPEP